MLACPTNISANYATKYYEADDYESQGQKTAIAPYWFGKGAMALGLQGDVKPEQFEVLLQGYSPEGKRLQAKLIDLDNHRAATDFTFSAPKSASIAEQIQEDQRVTVAFDRSVQVALKELENLTQARIWNPETKQQERVTTGNAIFAVFSHDESRNLDPQSHKHVLQVNSTQLESGEYRAIANDQSVRNQVYLGLIQENEFAIELQEIGFTINRKPNGLFELHGYAPELLEAFSTRRSEMLEAASDQPSAREMQWLAIKTRQDKQALSHPELKGRRQATITQLGLTLPALPQSGEPLDPEQAQQLSNQAVAAAIEDLLKESAVFTRADLGKRVLLENFGQFRFEHLAKAIDQFGLEIWDVGRGLYTDRQTAQQIEEITFDLFAQHTPIPLLAYAQNQEDTLTLTPASSTHDSSQSPAQLVGTGVAVIITATLQRDFASETRNQRFESSADQLQQFASDESRDFAGVADYFEALEREEAIRGIAEDLREAADAIEQFNRLAQLTAERDRELEQQRLRLEELERLNWRRPEPNSAQWHRANYVLDTAINALNAHEASQGESTLYRFVWEEATEQLSIISKADNRTIAVARSTPDNQWNIQHAEVNDLDWRNFQPRSRSQELKELEL